MKIALDAMGGDSAPQINILGAKHALAKLTGIEKLILVGEENVLRKSCSENELNDKRVQIVHASEVVEMGEKSIDAVRRKKKSSISIAVDLVKNGHADAFVSAGHTGACVAATTIKWRPIKGVDRPAIATPMPNDYNPVILIDAGANVDSKESQLFQNAVMGSIYARAYLGISKPRVGLMSVGGEDDKGNRLAKKVFTLLKESELNFIGNVEGHDIFETEVNVIVCDGFVGNVILKSCEATAKIMFKWLKEEFTQNPMRKLCALGLSKGFKNIKKKGNYENYGGSPLLGVNGICIIAHGSSSEVAIENAIRRACECVESNVVKQIKTELGHYQ